MAGRGESDIRRVSEPQSGPPPFRIGRQPPGEGGCHINLETQVDRPLFVSSGMERAWGLESKLGLHALSNFIFRGSSQANENACPKSNRGLK